MENGLINLMSTVQLINGLNIHPIPLDFDNCMTTTEILAHMQHIINELVNNSNKYNVELGDALKKTLQNLQTQLNTFIKECDYNVENYLKTITNHLDYAIEKRISEQVKLFQVGINEDGYFYIDTPTSWNEITFDTSENHELIIKY